MRHHLYVMSSSAPAPAGSGDTRSWFLFYKWNTTGELYVPQARPFLEVVEGDTLWFVMDGAVMGGALVLRTDEEESQNRQEIWYLGESINTFATPMVLAKELLEAREVPADVAERWLEVAGPLSTTSG